MICVISIDDCSIIFYIYTMIIYENNTLKYNIVLYMILYILICMTENLQFWTYNVDI